MPLAKTVNPKILKDYRPISLLFHCGKIAEFFMMSEYKKLVLPKLKNNQFAYQKNLGTVDALVHSIDQWTKMLDNKSTAAVNIMFKDFSKAFDCMQPKLLISRLHNMHIREDLIQLCCSFLQHREQNVRVGSSQSVSLPIEVGVPQGTICGPLFWITFIDNYDTPNISTTKYADDISCYWSTPRKDIQETPTLVTLPTAQAVECMNYGLQWSENNHMKLNVSKTKLMPISIKKACVYKHTIAVEVVKNFKFLGVTLDSHLDFTAHVDIVTKRAKKRTYLLTKLKHLGVDNEKLKLYYVSNIRSLMTYAAPVFFGFLTSGHQQSMESVQRLCTKIIMPDVESYTARLEHLELQPLVQFMDTLCQKYKHNMISCNTVMKDLVPQKNWETGLRCSQRYRDTYVIEKSRVKIRENSFVVKYFK